MIVDDGVATGATAKAACQVARAQGASSVVLAVPIGANDIDASIRRVRRRGGVLGDAGVILRGWPGLPPFRCDFRRRGGRLLDRARKDFPTPPRRAAADPPLRDEEIHVTAGPVSVAGHLTVPENPTGASSFSLMAAVAAGTARVIDMSQRSSTGPALPRCCSTCSRPTKNATAPMSSTSSCWHPGSST